MQELGSESKWLNYIMATMPIWWIGEKEGREVEPYVSPSVWEAKLIAAGFEGLEATHIDGEPQRYVNNVMIARRACPTDGRRPVTIVGDSTSEPTKQISMALQELGIRPTYCGLHDIPPEGQDVLVLLALENSFIHDISSDQFDDLKSFSTRAGSAGVFWVTQSSEIGGVHPQSAMLHGLARVLRNETGTLFATCEVDHLPSSLSPLMSVFERFQNRSVVGVTRPELEYIIKDGMVYTGRYHPFSLTQEIANEITKETKECEYLGLEVGRYGQVGSLRWSLREHHGVGVDQVEIKIKATGLNFRVSQSSY